MMQFSLQLCNAAVDFTRQLLPGTASCRAQSATDGRGF